MGAGLCSRLTERTLQRRPSTAISTAPWSKQLHERSAGGRDAGRRHYATIREIAAVEKINESYVGRVLRLTLLSPPIIEAILSGRQPAGLQLDGLTRRLPEHWERQRELS